MSKPPKKPIPYSRYYYPHYEDYKQKMRIWEAAMGIWLAKNQEEQPMSNPMTPTNDTIGQKIIQKHAPFFSPTDLAKSIDDAITAEKLALLDRLAEQIHHKVKVTTVQGIDGIKDGQYINVKNAEAMLQQEREAITKGATK